MLSLILLSVIIYQKILAINVTPIKQGYYYPSSSSSSSLLLSSTLYYYSNKIKHNKESSDEILFNNINVDDDDDYVKNIKAELIYEFTTKYKQIFRLNFITCCKNFDNNNNKNEIKNNVNSKMIIKKKIRKLQRLLLKQQNRSNIDSTEGYEVDEISYLDNNIDSIITILRTLLRREPLKENMINSKKKNFHHFSNKRDSNKRKYANGILIKVTLFETLLNNSSNNNNNSNNDDNNRNFKFNWINSIHFESENNKNGNFVHDSNKINFTTTVDDSLHIFNSLNNFENILRNNEMFHQFIILDLSCGLNETKKILKMASMKNMFNSSYHWLLINDNNYNIESEKIKDYDDNSSDNINNEPNQQHKIHKKNIKKSINGTSDDVNEEDIYKFIEDFFNNLKNININSEIIVAWKKNNRDFGDYYYQLFDVWSPGMQYGGKLNISIIGTYSKFNGLQIYDWYKTKTTILRRTDMNNVQIRCMIVVTNNLKNETLESYLESQRDSHLDSMNRFNFALLSHVRDMFNFKIILYRTNSWGYLKNGTFDGMIGALVNKQVDIGGTSIFFRIERAKVIDYTARTWVARPCFIFRHPKNNNKRAIFLQPLSTEVWISIWSCGLFIILSGWYMSTIEEKLKTTTNKPSDGINYYWKNFPGRTITRKNIEINTTWIQKFRRKIIQCFVILRKKFSRHNKSRISIPLGYSYSSSCHELKNNNNKKNKKNCGKLNDDCNNFYGYASKINYYSKFEKIQRKKDISKLSRKHNNNNNNNNSIKKSASLLSEIFMFFMGSLCLQGPSTLSQLFSGRIILFVTTVLGFFISQFYSASIVGALLSDPPSKIKTLGDLLKSSLDVGIEDIIYNRDFFRRTTDPDALEIYEKIGGSALNSLNSSDYNNSTQKEIKSSLFSSWKKSRIQRIPWLSPEKGVEYMKEGGYAFHVDVATAYKIIADTFTEREICDLSEIQLFPPQKMVHIVQKGSPLRKMITYGLRRTVESGLMDRQRKIWHVHKPRCLKQIDQDDLKVDMQTFLSAVYILIIGIATSFVILFFELFHNSYCKKVSTNMTRSRTSNGFEMY